MSGATWFDYANQAWVENGRYVSCAHPAIMNCGCFGRKHAGEIAPSPPQPVVNQEAITSDFEVLEALLAKVSLKTTAGNERKATAREFMWMHEKLEGWPVTRVVGFKHHDSRNYVFVIFKNGKEPRLHVPEQAQAFMRGTFDVFEPVGM